MTSKSVECLLLDAIVGSTIEVAEQIRVVTIGMDLCECVCHYIWAMRRLMVSLQSQTQCTETECFSEHPGYEGGVGSDPTATSYLLILLLWMVIAILLFLFRPQSLRRSGGKPSLPRSNDGRPPPDSSVQ